jgi:hypothetical protein
MVPHRHAFAALLLALGASASASGDSFDAGASAPRFKAATLEFSAEATVASANPTLYGTGLEPAPLTLGKASYLFSNGRGTAYAFGTGGTERAFFGLESTGTTPITPNGESTPLSATVQPGRFNAPYFALADNARYVGLGAAFAGGTVVRLGAVLQGAPAPAVSGTPRAPESRGVTVSALELQKSFAGTTGVVTMGQMHEKNSAMGLTGTGAMALAATPTTTFVTLAASSALSARTSLSAMVSMGRTAAYTNRTASLIDGASGSRTVAMSLGLASNDVLRSGDRLGVTLAIPVKTVSGSMRVTTAVSQDPDSGALNFASQSLALRPSGTEKALELAYTRPVSLGASFSAMAQVRLQPGHDARAPTYYGVGVRYTRTF